MPEQDRREEPQLENGVGYGHEPPQPTDSAASAIEAIGPGALPAEKNSEASDELSREDIETLTD